MQLFGNNLARSAFAQQTTTLIFSYAYDKPQKNSNAIFHTVVSPSIDIFKCQVRSFDVANIL